MDTPKTHELKCSKCGHFKVSASELEDILSQNFICPSCQSLLHFEYDEPSFPISCSFCDFDKSYSWLDSIVFINKKCPECEKGKLHIKNSFLFNVGKYSFSSKKISHSKLDPSQNLDYSEILIHFCTRDEITSILKSHKINSSTTGYFGPKDPTVKAVCLTEVPLPFADRMRKRQGDYGLAFFKKEVLKYGGQPAIYLTDEILKSQSKVGFSKKLKPFINVIRRPNIAPENKTKTYVDFSNEREWRIPKVVDLHQLEPIGLIFPEKEDKEIFAGKNWEHLIEYAHKYGEIQ